MALNLDGVILCTVEAARATVATGQPGAIVCTTSINACVTGQTIVIDGGQRLGARGDLEQAAEDTG
jgi:hypothetical protein